jgi:hypothetical protein
MVCLAYHTPDRAASVDTHQPRRPPHELRELRHQQRFMNPTDMKDLAVFISSSVVNGATAGTVVPHGDDWRVIRSFLRFT